MPLGGVTVQGRGKRLEREGTSPSTTLGASGGAHAIIGIALLILLAGMWACLWVPPWPIF